MKDMLIKLTISSMIGGGIIVFTHAIVLARRCFVYVLPNGTMKMFCLPF